MDLRGGCCSDYYMYRCKKQTPLNIAIVNRDIEIVDLLLDNSNIDPNIQSGKYGDETVYYDINLKGLTDSDGDDCDESSDYIISKERSAIEIAIHLYGRNNKDKDRQLKEDLIYNKLKENKKVKCVHNQKVPRYRCDTYF